MQLFHKPHLRDKNFRRAGCRREIAHDRFLACVLRDAKKHHNEANSSRDQPSEDLGRKWLQERNMPPLSILMLKFNRFLSKQGALRHEDAPRTKARSCPLGMRDAKPRAMLFDRRSKPPARGAGGFGRRDASETRLGATPWNVRR